MLNKIKKQGVAVIRDKDHKELIGYLNYANTLMNSGIENIKNNYIRRSSYEQSVEKLKC